MDPDNRRRLPVLLGEMTVEWERWYAEHCRTHPEDWSADRLDSLFQRLKETMAAR